MAELACQHPLTGRGGDVVGEILTKAVTLPKGERACARACVILAAGHKRVADLQSVSQMAHQ